MKIDFHCHMADRASIVCTDTPQAQYGASPSLLSCIGLLPDKWSLDGQELLFSRLLGDKNLHIGEIGLDKRFSPYLSLERQADILRRQLEFAISLNKCVSLHCVQATGPMLEILSSMRYRPYSVLWHGFTGSKETAARLSRLKVIISIGPSFSNDILDVFEANGCLVPETDYVGTDEAAHEALLKGMFKRMSGSLGWEEERLEDHCIDMFRRFSEREVQCH